MEVDITAVFYSFNLRTAEDILRLPDMKSILGVMRKLRVTSSGLKTKEEAQKVLLSYWIKHMDRTVFWKVLKTKMDAASLKSVVGHEHYQITGISDIMNIPDMKTARDLMKDWNIDTRGIKSKDDALHKLIHHWKISNETTSQKQSINGFQQAIADDKKSRNILSEKYEEVVEFYKRLPEQHQRDLDQFFNGIVATALQRKKELTRSDCTILIAGETSSGKSAFINLLLGKSILPTSHLQCTSTICEIRHSQNGRKYAILHHRSFEKKKRPPETIDLNNDNGLRILSDVVQQIDEETEESPYSQVQIYWPVPILEEGIVIVDTPGIGASRQLSKSVERYLTKSFGFIYVINSANAGGVQKGRLKDFLRVVTTSVDDNFDPRATMFICNKWDTVPETDSQSVYKNTLTQLDRCYPAVREDQIYRLSTTEASKAMEFAGSMTTLHQDVLKGLESLLPASLRNQLGLHYSWISQVLKRSMYSMKVAKLMVYKTVEEKEQTQMALRQQMDRLERDAKSTLEDMRRGVKAEVDKLYQGIEQLLSTTEIQSRIFRWDPDQCPPIENWKKVVKEAEGRIARRIGTEIDIWDNQRGIVRSLKEKIVKKFKHDFQMMENQMKDLEGVLLPGDIRTVSDFHKSMKRPAPVKKAGKQQAAKPTADSSRLGSAVASSGFLNIKSKDVRSLFKSYHKGDVRNTMRDACHLFIGSVLGGKLLRGKLDMFLGKYIKGIDDIAKLIPDLLKADRKLMETLQDEVKENKGNLSDIYPTLLRDCAKKQGLLDMFYVRCIMKPDIRVRDLLLDKSQSLGSGSFAYVVKGKLKTPDRNEILVAAKVPKETLNGTNVSDILLEDHTMRELRHENIVKYYGCVLSEDAKSRISWIMVMEICEGTLKSLFLDEAYKNPGKVGDNPKEQHKAMSDMSKYALGICKGLAHIHLKGLVHRDLKLENVLISLDGKVKLTDVGLTKGADLIAGTLVGSPVYMAPEVLVSKDIYDHKADIYSLGIMLWEMWYGIDAAIHIQEFLHKSLQESVVNGLRPQLSLRDRPPDDWVRIIQLCWDKEPSNRLDAKDVGSFFDSYYTKSSSKA